MAGTFYRRWVMAAMLLFAAVGLSGCLGEGAAPHLKPIPAAAQARLAKLGMTQDTPILVRIFKEEAELEVWKQKDDGQFHLFKTYPICFFSGELGPKLREGDKQAPEGFYTVRPGQMNPNSDFHLSFNLGYPNLYDAAHGRTGAHLMVHGDCSSAGCYAMTDALIEEIYAIAREAFEGGQREFHVHAFPFRMTDKNMARHRDSRWYSFWQTMKAGYDAFEKTRVQPSISVCEKRYLVNAEFFGDVVEPDPKKACPPHRELEPETILARLAGEKTRTAAQSRPDESGEPSEAERKTVSIPREASQQEPEEREDTRRPVIAASVAVEEQTGSLAQDDPDADGPGGKAETPSETEDVAEPWVVPEGTPAAPKGDRETRRSTDGNGPST